MNESAAPEPTPFQRDMRALLRARLESASASERHRLTLQMADYWMRHARGENAAASRPRGTVARGPVNGPRAEIAGMAPAESDCERHE